jgi:AcrR family transcriptional regulator
MTSSASEPRWRRLPEERPRQILDAAVAVFGEKGIAGARLEDIATRAGVSKGTIYLYFHSKEELFREVVRDTIVAAIERGEQLFANRDSAAEALRALLCGHWRFLRSPNYAALLPLILSELHHHPDLVEFYGEEVVARGIRLVAGIIEGGVASGEFRRVDPVVTARMLLGLAMSHAIWANRPASLAVLPLPPDEEIPHLVADFALHALRPISALDVPSAPRTPSR